MIPVDQRVVEMMTSKGFEKESVLKALANNRHNNITTTYYLLKKKNDIKESLATLNTGRD